MPAHTRKTAALPSNQPEEAAAPEGVDVLTAVANLRLEVEQRIDRLFMLNKELAEIVAAQSHVLDALTVFVQTAVTEQNERIDALTKGIEIVGTQQQWVTDRTSEAFAAFQAMTENGGLMKGMMGMLTGKNPFQNLLPSKAAPVVVNQSGHISAPVSTEGNVNG